MPSAVMRLSQRITHITGDGSDGWDVFYRARRMIDDGVAVIELTQGEHDARTHPDILDAMDRATRDGHTGYALVPGSNELRDTVAARIAARTGVLTTRGNVVITAGGQAALFAAHHATCDEGDSALFIEPYYTTYPGTIRSVGAVPVPVMAKPEHNFQPQPADIQAVAKGARSLLINSPNNPTGVVYTRETLTGIAQVCIDHDIWLISDEVYDTQVWEGEHISPRSLPEMADRTLVVGSMSKSHAMTGSRCGWICGPEDAISRIIDLVNNTNYGVSGFVQKAAHFALGQGVEPEDVVAAPFRRRRDLTAKALVGQNVVRAVPMAGAMYAMLDIRATGMSGEEFANALLDTHHIAVMPGESFGSAAAGHIRIAMTIADDAYVAALTTVIAFAQERASQKA